MSEKFSARSENGGGPGSSPEVIAQLISRIIYEKRPKTRYAAGQMAGMLLFIRKWFSDKFFDRMILKQFT
jgi:hypothetical protein